MASFPDRAPQLRRRIGSFQATAMNMSQMVGIGPFITIPAMIVAFGGPQAVVGWIAGAILALADGLVWAELGAAMPGSGGTYVYLREAFKRRTGRLMPFLFVWSAVLFIPLIMSTGVIGFVQYLGYLIPGMDDMTGNVVGLALIAVITVVLWRRIESLGRLTVVLWVIMVATVLTVILACFTHFNAAQVFDFPAGAFDISSGGFWVAFVAGLTIGIYDYLGYNTAAYMGAEMKSPGRTIPRSVVFSVFGIMVIYLFTQIGVLGVVKWQEMLDTGSQAYTSVVSLLLERTWGPGAAAVVTVFILVTAFASLLVGLLAGSRVPYDAARDGVFFKAFAKLHPTKEFPIAGLITMGVGTMAGFLIGRFTDISALIQLLTAVMVLVQALGQIAAVVLLRRRRDMVRPYRMWLYPLPLIVAGAGWIAVYLYSDANAPGLHPIELSLGWVALGVVLFLVWAKREKTWPFGPLPVEPNEVDAEIHLDEVRA
ncbi:Putative fructoselysine transporter FrlA [Sinomonas atrocyanea]|uniref:Putative fructoselysine transporter FrlA n=6 Tax=Sinomonas atrocyanea TaxID=37927 RepID=A0A126ZWW3_9MICC|nr:APC family permease [Sinomonas atrocyanea]AMM31020.1 Putative fructoselysine transporter FrlA [Sinomonas atrocyanea]AMM31660.1 Putative fructoselysine transporter FrlA [Sinomonas atrocyanea]GEB66649.1 amino acid permease [Sinomonas atrocyanea]